MAARQTTASGTRPNDCSGKADRSIPHLKLIVVEDGLASNAPHIRELKALDMHFILGAKPGDHAFLFEKVVAAWEAGRRHDDFLDGSGPGPYEINYINGVPLNEVSPDLHSELAPIRGAQLPGRGAAVDLGHGSGNFPPGNARSLVHGGRCRWKIENETFNTLKNQGYHFEHNYGHGEKNLSVVFAMLMMLAFLVDQVQQLCCPLFRAAWRRMGSKRALWESLRSHFRHFVFRSIQRLYQVMFYHADKKLPAPVVNTG